MSQRYKTSDSLNKLCLLLHIVKNSLEECEVLTILKEYSKKLATEDNFSETESRLSHNSELKIEKIEKSENNSSHTIVSPKSADDNVIKINRELFIDCHEKLLSYTASIQRPVVELPMKNIENIKKIEQIENIENIVDIPAH